MAAARTLISFCAAIMFCAGSNKSFQRDALRAPLNSNVRYQFVRDFMTTKYDKKIGLRMLPRWLIVLGFSFVLLISGCAGTPPRPTNIARNDYEPAKQYLSAAIKQDMAKHDVKGLSIALVDDHKVVWAKGFGYADVANQVPDR